MQPSPELLELIEAAKLRAGLPSDMSLDRALGVKNQVCRWRQGAWFPGDEVAAKLAALAGQDRRVVLAMIKALVAEKNNEPVATETWREIMRGLKATAAAVPMLLALMPGFGSQPAHAGEPKVGQAVYYV